MKRKKEMREKFKNDYEERDDEVMTFLNGRMAEGQDLEKRI